MECGLLNSTSELAFNQCHDENMADLGCLSLGPDLIKFRTNKH